MIKNFLSLYLPSYPRVVVYMLQASEYEQGPYLKWYWRTRNYTEVMNRRSLHLTRAAKLLLTLLRLGIALHIIACGVLIYNGIRNDSVGVVGIGMGMCLLYPVLWAHLILLPLVVGRHGIAKPAQKRVIQEAEQIFASHPAVKIAVLGSYGKTTMKELLATVLSEGKKVSYTPANKNVSISHAKFARSLHGDEEIVLLEYGEGVPGDIARFAQNTHPSHAVITGIAPVHLDTYKTLDAAVEDLFSIHNYVPEDHLFVNTESEFVKPKIHVQFKSFGEQGALGWKVRDVQISLQGTEFSLVKAKRVIKLKSGLIGRHQVGFLAFVAAFALDLGLTKDQVQAGIAKTKPFEHRMQPYSLAGAWIIDDTYNGNIEGIRAGTRLLQELDARRKMYVTPGLVEQGPETERVHIEMGSLIANAKPDVVVLMQNSVTDYIEKGLQQAGYKGEIRKEPNPLAFYSSLSHFVAHGDLVVMQNDWTDNYA